MDIKLLHPIENFDWSESVSQLFGVNSNFYTKNFGIPGHNALDVVVKNENLGFGATIHAMHAGTVEKIIYDVPHKTKGNGIYILDESKSFSTNYWHLSSFQVNIGDKITAWQPIATMGNSGRVFPEPSPACPRCGTHVHVGLKVHGINNSYGGFVDPTPYLWRKGDKLPIKFRRNLWWGSSGDDVAWLQTVLKLEELAKNYEPIGYFGPQTAMDVRALQLKYRISPAYGYVGDLTRKLLNNIYAI
jgi:hypothetical protein